MNVMEITILVLEPHRIKVFYEGGKIITRQETLSQSLAYFMKNEAPFYENATIWLHRKNTNCGDLRIRDKLTARCKSRAKKRR